MRGMPLVVVPAGEVTVTGTTAGLGLKLMPGEVTLQVIVAVPLVPTVADWQFKPVRSMDTTEPLPKPDIVTVTVDPAGNVARPSPPCAGEIVTGATLMVPRVLSDTVG
jgi:hypothetical protein